MLLKLKQNNPDFFLQLTPTTVSPILEALIPSSNSDDFEELQIMRDLDSMYRDWSSATSIVNTGLIGIGIASVIQDSGHSAVVTNDAEEAQPYETLIKLKMNPIKAHMMARVSISHKTCLQDMNTFIFAS